MNLTVIISLNYCISPSLLCALTLYSLSLSPSFLFSLPLTPSAPLHPTFDFLVCIWNSLCYWCTTFLLFLIIVFFVILFIPCLCYSVQNILCKRKGNKEYIYVYTSWYKYSCITWASWWIQVLHALRVYIKYELHLFHQHWVFCFDNKMIRVKWKQKYKNGRRLITKNTDSPLLASLSMWYGWNHLFKWFPLLLHTWF